MEESQARIMSQIPAEIPSATSEDEIREVLLCIIQLIVATHITGSLTQVAHLREPGPTSDCEMASEMEVAGLAGTVPTA